MRWRLRDRANMPARSPALTRSGRKNIADRTRSGGNMALEAPLRLALLGRFALMRGDLEIEIAAGGQRLVALLALRDRHVTRQYVAGNLWPEYSTERALADLRTTLWRGKQSPETVVTAPHPPPRV